MSTERPQSPDPSMITTLRPTAVLAALVPPASAGSAPSPLDDAITAGEITGALLRWFDDHQRALPWRDVPSPYRVWVSEIMLQQTQVATVLPYFNRWMERLPGVTELAAAELDEVLTLWSGLGYYRRARMLHAAASVVMERHGGELPGDVASLMKIPGIGRYTAGAIASIAFGVQTPLVDGNVTRVLSRLSGNDGDVATSRVQSAFWALATRLVPAERPGDLNQALMELGAIVCTPRKPACLLCPIQGRCVARAEGRELELPIKLSKVARRPMVVATAIIRHEGRVLLTQRPEEGLFGGLWEFPGLEVAPETAAAPVPACRDALAVRFAADAVGAVVGEATEAFLHTLSHIDLTVQPFFVDVGTCAPETLAAMWGRPSAWVPVEEVDGRALASIVRRIAAAVLEG